MSPASIEAVALQGGAAARLLPADQAGQEEAEVGGPLGEPAHEVGEPLVAVGDVHAQAVALGDDLLLQVAADPVEHLELERGAVAPAGGGELLGPADQARVVGGGERVWAAAAGAPTPAVVARVPRG